MRVMSWHLYLDDERFPKTERSWVIARSAEEAKALILRDGCPAFISFDHDLGEGQGTGHELAHWLVEQDLDGAIQIPPDFAFNVHSANPVGAANIAALLNSYLKSRRGKT
jgi:hypothetical protein